VTALGVILDSGNVLIRPTNGRWFPAPSFEEVLGERGLTWDRGLLDEALALGWEYLEEVHPVPLANEQAERPVWVRYHEIVLEGLGITSRRRGLAEAITAAWESTLSVEPYPWTVPVLAELQQRGVAVVILSDAWPSLRRFYSQLSLAPYIAAMVISGEEGITKPDCRVFEKALALLGRDASEVVFVDDWPGHVRAAVELGMRGFRLRHPDQEPDDGVEEIADLRELLARL
jgi:HAD superfamily hydrolase (TIGR01509 family)